MKRLQFDSSLRTGFKDIDQQHARLFKAANLVLFPPPDTSISSAKALVFLRDYTRYHFAAEEFLMDQLDYPGTKAHRSWHGRIIDEVAEIQAALRAQGDTRGIQARLHMAMDDWLRRHIQGSDLQFVLFIQKEKKNHNFLLPTLQHLLESGFDASDSMEVSVQYTEGQMTPAEMKARLNARGM